LKNDIPNIFIEIIKRQGRDYITPEDVSEAFKFYNDEPHLVRIDLLEILGGHAGIGAGDRVLCAYVGWKGLE
jgi:hypothetical protein